MNKKFFTLLVAFFAMIGLGAQATIVPGAVTTADYKTGNSYLFEATIGGGTDKYYLAVENNELVLIPATDFDGTPTYATLQKALWAVTLTKGTGTAVPTTEFKNVYTQLPLALSAESGSQLTGDLTKWIPSLLNLTAATNQYYVFQEDAIKVWMMAANDVTTPTKVIAKEAADVAGTLTEVARLNITPKIVDPASDPIVLSANDINTYFGKQGTYSNTPPTGFYANKDSYFQLAISPENTLANPFTGQLQAQAVNYVDLSGDPKTTGLVNTTTTVDADKFGILATAPYRDEDEKWVALNVKGGDKYIVVDTLYIPGTDQVNTGLIQTTTAKFAEDKRLADSYLFQFQYNAINNTVSIVSKAYIYKATNTGDPKEVETWKVSEADVQAAGNTYLNTNTYVVPAGANAANMNYLTYAELAYDGTKNAIVYTFGKTKKEFKVILDAAAKYQATRVQTGVYLLKIVGSTDVKSIGKYLKTTLGGKGEFAVEATRQNFQNMPATHWVIESTSANTAMITNREFKNVKYLQAGTITYKTANKGEFFTLGGDTIQYIPVKVTNDKKQGYKYLDKDEYSERLNSYVFKYLHDLSLNNPVVAKDGGRQPLYVNSDKDGDFSNFRLEEVLVDTYGYGAHLTGVAQLERSAYMIATYKAISFEKDKYYVTYDEDDKQYYLISEEEMKEEEITPSIFFLKENNENVNEEGKAADPYYVLVEASIEGLGNNFVEIKLNSDNKYEVVAALANGIVTDEDYAANRIYVLGAKDKDGNWFAREFENASVPAGYTPLAVTGANAATHSYAQFNFVIVAGKIYATSKVSVDNNTLAMVNGVLDDSKDKEVSNSAFMLGKDDDFLYRTIGDEEDEDALEQNIRIYRVNASTPEYLYEDANSVYSTSENDGKGPNKPEGDRESIKDQINFLGVEGKGDDKFVQSTMTARYVRGTVMPQYILMLGYERFEKEAEMCPVCAAMKPEDRPANCPHDEKGESFSKARVLVSLTDSVSSASVKDKSIFQWNKQTRLAFVDAVFTDGVTGVKDSVMTIVSSNVKLEKNQFAVKFKDASTTAAEGTHKTVFFSLRLIEEGNKQFLLESDGEIGGKEENTWVKVQNGVPVLVTTTFDDAINSEAELFDLEATDDKATSNEGINNATFEVTAGVGSVTIKGAANKQVVITNILGKVVANVTLASDYETLSAPAGVVVVAVDGEATKALVK